MCSSDLAGIDRFPRALVEQYLGWWCAATGRSVEQLMELGSEPGGDPDMFNLAAMSLRLAGWAGGVSELHGGVSRDLFHSLWPHVATEEVPITTRGLSPWPPKQAMFRSDCSMLVGMPVEGPPRWTSTTTSGISAITAQPKIGRAHV